MCIRDRPETRRLFLALWPEDTVRRDIAALATEVAGRRRIRDANLHLTLVFLDVYKRQR